MLRTASHLDTRIRSAKVLLVGADFATRKLIRTLLLQAGVTDVHDAADGLAALAAAAELDLDVMVLDWQVAPMRGAEFVRQLRALDPSPASSVPIIMLADHNAAPRVIEAMRLGVHEFLVQPVSAPALRERLASALMTPRPRRPIAAPSLQPQEQAPLDVPSLGAIVAK
jgi:PleD family two-component response regulator